MTLLGDALALAGWIIAFDLGLVTDPHPLYRACSSTTLDSILATVSQNSGVLWMAVAEGLWRAWLLRADWSFACTGIRCARITYHATGEATDTMRAIYMGAA